MVKDCKGLQEKKKNLPEEKRVSKSIKERIRNSLKVSYRFINNKMSSEILNSYYSVDNGTWLCDKFIFLQSSNILCPSLSSTTTSLLINTATKR